jgi:hypothetical protein
MSCEKLLERISINPDICFEKPASSCVPSSACLSDLCGGFGFLCVPFVILVVSICFVPISSRNS